MELLTVKELTKKCNNLNISLTNTNGTRKLKKELIHSLDKLQIGGKKCRRSSKKTSVNRKVSKKTSKRRSKKTSKSISKKTSKSRPRSKKTSKSRPRSKKTSKKRKVSKKTSKKRSTKGSKKNRRINCDNNLQKGGKLTSDTPIPAAPADTHPHKAQSGVH